MPRFRKVICCVGGNRPTLISRERIGWAPCILETPVRLASIYHKVRLDLANGDLPQVNRHPFAFCWDCTAVFQKTGEITLERNAYSFFRPRRCFCHRTIRDDPICSRVRGTGSFVGQHLAKHRGSNRHACNTLPSMCRDTARRDRQTPTGQHRIHKPQKRNLIRGSAQRGVTKLPPLSYQYTKSAENLLRPKLLTHDSPPAPGRAAQASVT